MELAGQCHIEWEGFGVSGFEGCQMRQTYGVFLSFCVSTGLIIRRFTRRSNTYGKQGAWTENIAVVVTVFLLYHCVTTLTFVQLSKTYALSVSCAETRQFNPLIVQNQKIAWMCDFI